MLHVQHSSGLRHNSELSIATSNTQDLCYITTLCVLDFNENELIHL